MNLIRRLGRAFHTLSMRLTMPVRIEFDVTDTCNLNCKGCSHYSSLAPAVFENLESLDANMYAISSIKGATRIREVYIIGGETLLYPHLNEAMSMARRYFPKASISIFTNGLLLPKMSDDFWQSCRTNYVTIALTRYPINFDYDAVLKLCTVNGVRSTIFGDRSLHGSFFRFGLDPSKSQNKWKAHFRCYSFGCITVRDSKIFPCSISACVEHLNKRFNSNFTHLPGDFIDLTDGSLKSIYQILHLRNLPIPFCAHCTKAEVTEYAISKKNKSEWIV